MSHHTQHPLPTKRCVGGDVHDWESWLFAAAVRQGTWTAVRGINFEIDARGGLHGWKVLRCGCVAVVCPVDGDL